MKRTQLGILIAVLAITGLFVVLGCDRASDETDPGNAPGMLKGGHDGDDADDADDADADDADADAGAAAGGESQTGEFKSTVNTGPLPDGCVKIEGGQIGKEAISVEVDGVTVTITKWLSKDEKGGEFIGFEYEVDGGAVEISIKASTEVFYEDDDGIWMHPAGNGKGARAISNIVFCKSEGNGDQGGEGEGQMGGEGDAGGEGEGQMGGEGDTGGEGEGQMGGEGENCADCEDNGSDADETRPV